MANWCNTTFRFEGPSTKDVKSFHQDLLSIFSDGQIDFDSLASYYGGDITEIDGASGYVNYISEYDSQNNYFTIDAESRWSPNIDLFAEILAEKYPSIKMYYIAEEPGEDIYCKYDPYSYWDNYIVNSDSDTDYFITEGEVIDYLMGYENIDPYSFRKYIASHNINTLEVSFLNALVAYIDDKYPEEYLSVRMYDLEDDPLLGFLDVS